VDPELLNMTEHCKTTPTHHVGDVTRLVVDPELLDKITPTHHVGDVTRLVVGDVTREQCSNIRSIMLQLEDYI